METYHPRHAQQTQEEQDAALVAQAHNWFDGFADTAPGSDEYKRYQDSVMGLKNIESNGHNIGQRDLEMHLADLALLGSHNRLRHLVSPVYRERYRRAELLGRDLVRSTFAWAEAEATNYDSTMIDPMTNLLSKTGVATKLLQRFDLNEDFPLEQAALKEGQAPAELVVIDGDGAYFKRINDVLGHHIGDAAIKELADELSETLRDSDGPLIAHYSGDEFGVIFANLSREDQETIESRIMHAQVDKVAAMRYATAWQHIKARKEQVLAEGQSLRIEAAPEPLPHGVDPSIRPRTMLIINGEPLLPLRDISILAIGVARGPAMCWQDYEALKADAETRMVDTKMMLHRFMPHDESLDTRKEEFASTA